MEARELWHETGLAFTTSIGTELDSHNVRRSMRRLTKAAGLGESWTPRELRHTFVSIAGAAHESDRHGQATRSGDSSPLWQEMLSRAIE